jgi:hypothetical protein
MPVTRRYYPEHPPGESCLFGLDFSAIIPVGVGVKSGTLSIATNVGNSQPADGDWEIGPVLVRGRSIYANLTGGVLGIDYMLQWVATDTNGDVWPRVALILCAYTS